MESPWLSRLRRVCRLACCARPLPGSVFGLEGGCRTSPIPNVMQGKRRMERNAWRFVGRRRHRERPEENQREIWGRRVRVGERARRRREKWGGRASARRMGRQPEAGMDGDGTGHLKGKSTPRSAPALGTWGAWGAGVARAWTLGENGLNLVVLEGLRQAEGAQPCCCRSVGPSSGWMLRMLGEQHGVARGSQPGGVMAGWMPQPPRPHPNGITCGDPTVPGLAAIRQRGHSQFEEAKGNLRLSFGVSPLPFRFRAARLSSLLNSLFKI